MRHPGFSPPAANPPHPISSPGRRSLPRPNRARVPSCRLRLAPTPAALNALTMLAALAALVLFVSLTPRACAQWMTQTNALRPGWNAVFLHVDPSHVTIDTLLAADATNPIEEIWAWQPPTPSGQFIESPLAPTGGGSQWRTWSRAQGASSALRHLAGNGAYLVKVASAIPTYVWRVQGRPVIPTYRWTLTGLNFLGFPVPTAPAPTYESFLLPAPQLQQNGEIYRYQGGELNTTNPVRVVAFRTTPVRRDQAYWIRAGESYNEYFGPIQLLQTGPGGIRFGATVSQASLRLRNAANVPVTVTMQQITSEPAPAGQPELAGALPLLLRGALNPTNLTHGYSILSAAPQSWSLAAAGQPGSEVEIVLGLNRTQLAGAPGAPSASILRFTDSLGLAQIDLAASAEKESPAGLWVGTASLEYVSHYLKPYAKVASEADLATLLGRLQLAQGANGYRYERDAASGRVLVFGGPDQKAGSYLLDGPVRIDSGAVATPYPMRLIVHHDGSGARLLQKVFHGVGLGSNTVLATRESLLLPAELTSARRISSVHFPTSAGNLSWPFSGSVQPGASLTATVALAHDDGASNPFLHAYHPDHDNLDATFTAAQPRGVESYGVRRQITLTFSTPANDFASLTRGSLDLNGTYAEVMTFEARGAQTRQYNVLGTFSLKRLSDIATLTSN